MHVLTKDNTTPVSDIISDAYVKISIQEDQWPTGLEEATKLGNVT